MTQNEERDLRQRIAEEIEAAIPPQRLMWVDGKRCEDTRQLADRCGWESGMHQAARIAAGQQPAESLRGVVQRATADGIGRDPILGVIVMPASTDEAASAFGADPS